MPDDKARHSNANRSAEETYNELMNGSLLSLRQRLLEDQAFAGLVEGHVDAGEDADGNKLWVHCASGTGVVLNSPDYVTQYRRRNDVDLEGDLVPAALDVEEAGASG